MIEAEKPLSEGKGANQVKLNECNKYIDFMIINVCVSGVYTWFKSKNIVPLTCRQEFKGNHRLASGEPGSDFRRRMQETHTFLNCSD